MSVPVNLSSLGVKSLMVIAAYMFRNKLMEMEFIECPGYNVASRAVVSSTPGDLPGMMNSHN